jgi:hypothetical protein
MKKILVALLVLWAAPALALSLECPAPPGGSETPLFYYVTGMPAGTVATYTAVLPNWFTATGGVAAAPDSTGATGFKLPLPASFTTPSVTGTVMACDGVGCTAAVPFGPPSTPGSVLLVSP